MFRKTVHKFAFCSRFEPSKVSQGNRREMKFMKNIPYIIYAAALVLLLACPKSSAQVKIASGVEMDKDVHDFGDIIL